MNDELLTDRLESLVQDDQMTEARAVARTELHTHEPSDIEVGEDTVTVHCGPFTGYHALRRDRDGERWPTSIGSYVHDPTGVEFSDSQSESDQRASSQKTLEFEAECPNEGVLDEHVSRAMDAPHPRDAAKTAYRRTRL